MTGVLITVRLPPGATLDSALRELGLDTDEVDVEYGLVPVDPVRGLYAMRVTESAGHRIAEARIAGARAAAEPVKPPGSSGRPSPSGPSGPPGAATDTADTADDGTGQVGGPYADPPIEPYGPPR
ncbi:hypothetical protein JOL79_09950 [Microbispora sp. RL4-1S]|uniref:Uncharacterized protein n=1 Tax=Microbispora oryzae TaxID=2806554 RepID=A0A940WHK0_9ACTN|nr:hypothetical protein [Microbispora oryzae]MBP2704132.1 hypothetical protein [Microbispora oryzae]